MGQTVLARWHQPVGSVGAEFRKGPMASAHPNARHFSVSLYITGAFQAATLGAGAQREWLCLGESICGFFKRNCLGLQKFLPPTHSPLYGLRSGWDSSLPRYPFWIFIHQTWVRTILFCVCTTPTSLDGRGFFNSIVVRLPFHSISDSSEWWLLYILVVRNFDVVVRRGHKRLFKGQSPKDKGLNFF